MTSANCLLLAAILLPAVTFANPPWQNVVNTPEKVNEVCSKFGTITQECIAVLGSPEVLGKISCVAKDDDSSRATAEKPVSIALTTKFRPAACSAKRADQFDALFGSFGRCNFSKKEFVGL